MCFVTFDYLCHRFYGIDSMLTNMQIFLILADKNIEHTQRQIFMFFVREKKVGTSSCKSNRKICFDHHQLVIIIFMAFLFAINMAIFKYKSDIAPRYLVMKKYR